MALADRRPPPDPVPDARTLADRYYEAFNARDAGALRAICAPDVVLVIEAGRVQGIDQLVRYIDDVHHHFPGVRAAWSFAVVLPDRVVCENREVAPPGATWRLNGRVCEIIEVRDGRIVELRNYYVPGPHDRTGAARVLVPGETFKVAQEQAALRRVASLLARDPDPEAIFAAVNREIGLIVAADATSLFAFFDDDTMQLVATWTPEDAPFPIGDRRPMNPPIVELRRTGMPVRFDVLPDGAPFLEEARAYGVRSAIAVPLIVEDEVWGVVFATSRGPGLFPRDTEDRAMRFTELAGIALAHSRARASLAASRARVLAAADASRRQVQRDLHDGAQQRLVHTVLELELARDAAAGHACAAEAHVREGLRQAGLANAELRDLVRGILPATLTRHGLGVALSSYAEELPLRVALDVEVDRLPIAVETTAYFVTAEALTNVVKHAGVDRAQVTARLRDGALALQVEDEGAGGARAAGGTGLRGMADRVEGSGGTFAVDSPAGGGTRVRAWIPLPPA